MSASLISLARCRATAPDVWPPQRCTEDTGHGRVHHTGEDVWWIGDEPEPGEPGESGEGEERR